MPLNEGQTVQYTVTTTRVADGTVLYWKTTGNTTASDIVGGNTGSVIVTNNRAYINVAVSADQLPDETKTLGVIVLTGSLNGTAVATTDPNTPIVINDTSNTAPLTKIYSWGYNLYGVLGLNGGPNVSSPTQIGANTNWSNVSTQEYFAVATKTNGTLWSWGTNDYGQLGLNSITRMSSPTQIGSGTTWSKISAGDGHASAIKTDGTLWAWGKNFNGQVPNNYAGSGVSVYTPEQIGTNTNWSTISNGASFGWGIKTNGTLWSWGFNQFGQSGQNTSGLYVGTSSPTQVGTNTNWSSISTHGQKGLAIKTDGTLWAWGQNPSGSLGTNDTINQSSPTQVGTDTNWSTIGLGLNHTLATKTDGTLWAWGANNGNQLGINGGSVSSPTQIGSLNNWSNATGGKFHSIARKNDGTLWLWGYNEYGTIGNSSRTTIVSPIQIGAGTTWLKISAGTYANFAITSE